MATKKAPAITSVDEVATSSPSEQQPTVNPVVAKARELKAAHQKKLGEVSEIETQMEATLKELEDAAVELRHELGYAPKKRAPKSAKPSEPDPRQEKLPLESEAPPAEA